MNTIHCVHSLLTAFGTVRSCQPTGKALGICDADRPAFGCYQIERAHFGDGAGEGFMADAQFACQYRFGDVQFDFNGIRRERLLASFEQPHREPGFNILLREVI